MGIESNNRSGRPAESNNRQTGGRSGGGSTGKSGCDRVKSTTQERVHKTLSR